MNAMVKTDAIVGAPQHPASEMATFLICKIYLIYNLYSLYSSNVLYLVYKSTPLVPIVSITALVVMFPGGGTYFFMSSLTSHQSDNHLMAR